MARVKYTEPFKSKDYSYRKEVAPRGKGGKCFCVRIFQVHPFTLKENESFDENADVQAVLGQFVNK